MSARNRRLAGWVRLCGLCVELARSTGARRVGGLGQLGSWVGAAFEELGEVVARVHQRPFAAHSGEPTSTKAAPAAVFLGVAEDRLDGVRALSVGLGAFGGAQTVLHGFER